ncbi:Serine/threonine-protein phosphatase 6 regulatory subunit 3 [Daphnia magna]|uniref:Serine/threonine-protein phosphatase 6 regulatory subunit 3 n=1 Tax=Daphnia magna TaxID=35525 RepID=A0A164FD16_9CRUS|nr:Serine/threonine-protein phosphatase 6 regulatory subunit 3 [Daphnia magna]
MVLLKAIVELLLDSMLGSELCESSFVHGITVLLTLLQVHRDPQLLSSEPEVLISS